MIAAVGRRGITAAAVAILLIVLLTVTFHQPTYDALASQVSLLHGDPTATDSHGFKTPPEDKPKSDNYWASQDPTKPENNQEKYAYVTLLSGTVDAPDDLEQDNYFVATRILLWQLLHNPKTRTKHDVIVMVTPSVSEHRRERLKKDGANVMSVDFVRTKHDKWIHGGDPRWADLMTKFRAWELTQYTKILMMDGDSMLRSSLDGIFDDPGTQIQKTDFNHPNATVLPGQKPFPDTYMLGAGREVWDSNHEFPPGPETGLKGPGYFNAGFFLLAPSLATFEYYKSLLDIKDSFDPTYMEQNLLNFAHRWDGPMPWKEISYTWGLRCPNENDFEKGLVSMHEKWWSHPYLYDNQKVKDWMTAQRWEMKGWYDAWDLRNQSN